MERRNNRLGISKGRGPRRWHPPRSRLEVRRNLHLRLEVRPDDWLVGRLLSRACSGRGSGQNSRFDLGRDLSFLRFGVRSLLGEAHQASGHVAMLSFLKALCLGGTFVVLVKGVSNLFNGKQGKNNALVRNRVSRSTTQNNMYRVVHVPTAQSFRGPHGRPLRAICH